MTKLFIMSIIKVEFQRRNGSWEGNQPSASAHYYTAAHTCIQMGIHRLRFMISASARHTYVIACAKCKKTRGHVTSAACRTCATSGQASKSDFFFALCDGGQSLAFGDAGKEIFTLPG